MEDRRRRRSSVMTNNVQYTPFLFRCWGALGGQSKEVVLIIAFIICLLQAGVKACLLGVLALGQCKFAKLALLLFFTIYYTIPRTHYIYTLYTLLYTP